MTSASYDSNFTAVESDGDPQRRVGTARTIAGANMLIGIVSVIYHIWTLVQILRFPETIENTGQTDVIIYMGLVIMIIIGLALLPVSWKLFQTVGMIRSTPDVAIQNCVCWRRLMGCFLSFFIVSLMVLVVNSEQNVHQGVQNYIIALLIVSIFSIFGLYYIAKLINEIKSYNDNVGTDLNNVCPQNNEI